MLYLLWIIAVIAGLILRKSKYVVRFQLFVYWVLVSLNTSNPDYENYKFSYYNIVRPERLLRGGWDVLQIVFRKLGFSYHLFLAVLVFVLLLITVRVIRRITDDAAFCMSLYLLYPMCENVIQLKTFAAATLLLWGISVLVEERRHWFLKSLILFVLAMLVHMMSVYFVVLLLVPKVLKLKMSLLVTVSVLGALILLYVLPKLIPYVMTSQGADVYFNMELAGWKKWGLVLWHVCGVMLMYMLYFMNCKKSIALRTDNDAERKILICNLLFLPCCAMYSITSVGVRFYRSLFLLNYVYVAPYFPRSIRERKTIVEWLLLLLCLLYMISTVWFMYILNNRYDYLFAPIFEHNLLLGT